MSTYAKCPSTVASLGDQIIKKHYQDLKDAEVTVMYLFAFAAKDEKTGEPKGPAIKHNGYPALAIVRVNKLKDRVAGLMDATIEIDGDQWADMDDDRRVALIDHELMHLEVKRDDAGGVVADDIGRPVLKIRPHDFEIGGFHDIAQRHGYASEEAKAVQGVVQKWEEMKLVQGEFHWG